MGAILSDGVLGLFRFVFVRPFRCVTWAYIHVYSHVLDSPGIEFFFYKVTRPKSCNQRTHFLASRVVLVQYICMYSPRLPNQSFFYHIHTQHLGSRAPPATNQQKRQHRLMIFMLTLCYYSMLRYPSYPHTTYIHTHNSLLLSFAEKAKSSFRKYTFFGSLNKTTGNNKRRWGEEVLLSQKKS